MAGLDQLKTHFTGLIKGLSWQILELASKLDAQNKIMEDQKTVLDAQDKTIMELKNSLNDLEQYTRNSNVRINGHALSAKTDKTDGKQVLKDVYETLLVPILNLAVDAGEIDNVPPMETLLEYGHVLITEKADLPSSIIIRFYSRYYRSMVFRYKLAFLNPAKCRSLSSTMDNPELNLLTSQPSVISMTYINEDLTQATYIKLKDMIKERDDVKRAWTLNGKIRYITNEDNDVKLLKNVF